MEIGTLLELLPQLGFSTEHVLAWITIGMSVATIVAKILDFVVPRLRAYASTTPETWDDKLAMRLAWIGGLLNAFLPRAVVGPLNPKAGTAVVMNGGASDTFPAGLAVLLLVLTSTLSGCNMTPLQRHVAIAESLDAAITADAVAFEQRVATTTIEAVIRECQDGATFEDCRRRVARDTAERFERWGASHNATADARDLYVAALRDSTSDEPSINRLLDEALTAVNGLIEVARAFGANIDISHLLELIE